MMDRIHAVLDGELPREALDGQEAAHLQALEAILGEAARAVRTAPVPELSDAVMRAIAATAPPAPGLEHRPAMWKRLREWLWSPRELALTFRPAQMLACLAVAAIAVVFVAPRALEWTDQQSAPMAAAPGATGQRVYVQFRLDLPNAHQVRLAGSFTDWQPRVELHEVTPGVWTVLVPLDPGVHDYTFVVDGRWVADTSAPQVADDFGGTNSRLFLPVPGERAS